MASKLRKGRKPYFDRFNKTLFCSTLCFEWMIQWFNHITIMVTITCRKKNQLMNSFGELDSKDSSHWDESQPRPRENSVWIVTF